LTIASLLFPQHSYKSLSLERRNLANDNFLAMYQARVES
jgi:hypothetical protein